MAVAATAIHKITCKNPKDNKKPEGRELKKISKWNQRSRIWKEFAKKHKIPNKFRPDKFIFLTDTPLKLSESHKFNIDAQNIMQKYLFDELDNKNFNFKLRFLDPFKLRRQWWKHKRHFAFSEGPKSINDSKNNNQPVSLLIDSEFGPEFVDEKDNSKINNINKFVVIKDSGNIHLIDISNEIANNI